VPRTFDADFYVTCATVIPVLFIALTIERGTFYALLRLAEQAVGDPRWKRWLPRWLVSRGLSLLAYGCWVAGILGECFALFALAGQSELGDGRALVLGCTLYLALLAGASPLNAYLDTRRKLDKLLYRPSVPEAAAAGEQADPPEPLT
jgi:hypothetical protein